MSLSEVGCGGRESRCGPPGQVFMRTPFSTNTGSRGTLSLLLKLSPKPSCLRSLHDVTENAAIAVPHSDAPYLLSGDK